MIIIIMKNKSNKKYNTFLKIVLNLKHMLTSYTIIKYMYNKFYGAST